MDNKSAFSVTQYDDKIRKVIPFYDAIYDQIFDVIRVHSGSKKISVLDTGCGTGTFGARASETLNLERMVLCDPSEAMLSDAKKKVGESSCEFRNIGSEELDYNSQFDIVTAIQSHHYFDRNTRERAVQNCFNALRPGGIFICFENTASFSEVGKDIMLRQLEDFEIKAGRPLDEVKAHSARYGKEFFPITVTEHLELLRKVGFKAVEILWHSYMQSGFYAVK